MLSRFVLLGLVGAMPAAVLAASGKGHTTRYWDCCKTSCAWEGKAKVSEPVLTCDNRENPIVDANAKSGCDGGGAFACTNNSPWAVSDDVAYGFAATALSGLSESSWCCGCYAITFTSGPIAGKKMVVQSTNTGGDLSNNHFDLMIPGGGLGIFDGCSAQFGQLLPGARYGGVSSRSECDLMPELLKDGCQWRFDWFKNADNPDIEFEQVQCPKEIVAVSGCVRDDDSTFPVFNAGVTSPKPSTTSKAPAQPATSSATKAATGTGSPQQHVENKTTAVQSTPTPAAVTAVKPDDSVAKPSTASSSPASKPSTTGDASASKPTSTVQVALWGQCDSKAAWKQPLKCEKGSKCVYVNDWYSQCQPKNSCA